MGVRPGFTLNGAVVTVPNCIFCDQPFGSGRRRSQEHAAPQWCAELLPDLGPALHGHIRVTAEGRQDKDLGERNPFTTVCSDVCEPCNTGWMHELEESAKWILRPLPYAHAVPAALERKLVQVWPPKYEIVSWPPPDTLDDRDVKSALVSLGLPMDGEGANLIVDSP